MSVHDKQIGGDHYRAEIQHWDFITDNGFSYLRGCATKYLARYRKKNGLEDLHKAEHYIEKLREGIRYGKWCPSQDPDDHKEGVATLTEFLAANNIPEIDHPPFWWVLYGTTVNELTAALTHIQVLIKNWHIEHSEPHPDHKTTRRKR